MILPIDRGDIPDGLLVFVECSGEIFTIGDIDNLVMRSAVQFAAMLSTGLRDAAGVEVFEGDVVEYDEEPSWYYPTKRTFRSLVEWSARFPGFEPFRPRCGDEDHLTAAEVRVVGNIWETPSLREGCAPP
jgi:hypothetical protein